MLYFIGLPRYAILGKILSEYLCCDFCEINESEAKNIDFQKDDLIYANFFIKKGIINGGTLIDPDYDIAWKWDSKFKQYKELQDLVPVPKFSIMKVFPLLKSLSKTSKAHLTTEHGTAGKSSFLFDETSELGDVYKKYRDCSEIRVSEYVKKIKDISIHIVIANEDDIFVSPICRQKIGKIIFRGGEYPAGITEEQENMVKNYALKIAKVLAKDGYVGLCGIDFMVSERGEIYLSELNPRKMATTSGVSFVMENDYNTTIPILEYHAAVEKRLPKVEKIKESNFEWDFDLIYGDDPEFKDFPGEERMLFKTGGGTVKYFEPYDNHRVIFNVRIKK